MTVSAMTAYDLTHLFLKPIRVYAAIDHAIVDRSIVCDILRVAQQRDIAGRQFDVTIKVARGELPLLHKRIAVRFN